MAQAGSNIQVKSGDTYSLDGTDSYDPEGSALMYRWTLLSNTVSHDSKPVFTAQNVDKKTTYIFELVVNDGQKDSAPSKVSVEVIPSEEGGQQQGGQNDGQQQAGNNDGQQTNTNSPPTANAGKDLQVNSGIC